MFFNVLNLYGTGWFKCDRCEYMFESAIIPSIIIRCPRCGRIIVSPKTKKIINVHPTEVDIVNETIEWADELYSHCDENVKMAYVLLELHGDILERRFYYIREGQLFYIKFPEIIDIDSLKDEVLQSKQFDELKRNGRVIIKKY